jgi:hypothetical protein
LLTPAIPPEVTHLSDETTPVRLRSRFNLLTPSDLAALIGIDERTLAVWRVQRRGPDFVKLGRAVFYRATDINVWIDLNTTGQTRRTTGQAGPHQTLKAALKNPRAVSVSSSRNEKPGPLCRRRRAYDLAIDGV